MKITGVLALLATAALAALLIRSLNRHVIAGKVYQQEEGRIWIDPDVATVERYVWLSGALPKTLETWVSLWPKSDSAFLSVPAPPFKLVSLEDVHVEHREFDLPWTRLGVGRTRYALPGRELRPSFAPVYLAYAGASAAPLILWGLAGLVTVLSTPRRQGIMKPA